MFERRFEGAVARVPAREIEGIIGAGGGGGGCR